MQPYLPSLQSKYQTQVGQALCLYTEGSSVALRRQSYNMTFGPHEGLNRTQQLWLILPVHSSLLLAHIPPTSQALSQYLICIPLFPPFWMPFE